MRKFMVVVLAGMLAGASRAKADDPQVQLMFVQVADDMKVDATTLRLVGFAQQTLYFADRPVRTAGHLTMAGYLDEWKANEGPDNFGSNPPNATLSVYGPGQATNTLAVIIIRHPIVDGHDFVYNYKIIEGAMPQRGGVTSLFIIGSELAAVLAAAPMVSAPAHAASAGGNRRSRLQNGAGSSRAPVLELFRSHGYRRQPT
jgi:hypothetical protein